MWRHNTPKPPHSWSCCALSHRCAGLAVASAVFAHPHHTTACASDQDCEPARAHSTAGWHCSRDAQCGQPPPHHNCNVRHCRHDSRCSHATGGNPYHCVAVWTREPHAHMRGPQAADAADEHRRHAEEAVVALTTQRQTWLAKLSTLQLRVDELTAQLANEQVRNVAVCAASPKSLRR